MNGDSKYKLFRNFMVNELQIGRADIEQWTKEAVAVEVARIVKQTNMDALVREQVRLTVNAVLADTIAGRERRSLRQEIADRLVDRLLVTINRSTSAGG